MSRLRGILVRLNSDETSSTYMKTTKTPEVSDLYQPISGLDMCAELDRILLSHNIEYLGDLILKSPADLQNFLPLPRGPISVPEVERCLKKLGYKLQYNLHQYSGSIKYKEVAKAARFFLTRAKRSLEVEDSCKEDGKR